LQELRVTACNGLFAGQVNVYASKDTFIETAAALRGFPAEKNDHRHIELGALAPGFAGGGARLGFDCTDAAGHAVVKSSSEATRRAPPSACCRHRDLQARAFE